jgi:uncharacterized membrane protein
MITVRIRFIVLTVILAAAAILRLHKLGEGSFWFDEQGSVIVSAGHLADSINIPVDQAIDPPDLTSLAHAGSWLAVWKSPDVHPPLYPLMLRAWRDCFGDGDVTIRMFSVAASLAAILLLFDLGKTLAGPEAALWACAMMALAQPQIEYAQEARDYALWTAFGLGAAAAAARLIVYGAGWRRTICLDICLAALTLIHFFAFFTVGAVILWCLLYLRGKALRQTAVATAAFSLVLLPFSIHFLVSTLSRNHDAGWMQESPAGHVATTLWRLALLPASFLAYPTPSIERISSVSAVAYILPLILLKRKGDNRTFVWCFLWLWAGTITLGLLDLINSTGILDHIRFALIAAPAYYLLIASLPLWKWLKRLVCLAAIMTSVLALPTVYNTQWKGQWRQLGQDLHRTAGPSDIVIFASAPNAFLSSPEKMYQGVAYYSQPIPCRVILLDKAADPSTVEILKSARHVWIIQGQDSGPLENYLPGWHFRLVPRLRGFPGQLVQATQ